jgi:hypothetical protein
MAHHLRESHEKVAALRRGQVRQGDPVAWVGLVVGPVGDRVEDDRRPVPSDLDAGRFTVEHGERAPLEAVGGRTDVAVDHPDVREAPLLGGLCGDPGVAEMRDDQIGAAGERPELSPRADRDPVELVGGARREIADDLHVVPAPDEMPERFVGG